MIYFKDGLPFFFGGHSFGGRCHGCSVALVVGVCFMRCCCLGGLAPVIVIISDKTVREVDLGANLRRLDVSAKIGELWRAFSSNQVSS